MSQANNDDDTVVLEVWAKIDYTTGDVETYYQPTELDRLGEINKWSDMRQQLRNQINPQLHTESFEAGLDSRDNEESQATRIGTATVKLTGEIVDVDVENSM